MVKSIGLYPRVRPDASGVGVVSQAGAVSLVETLRAAGLDTALSRALARWRKPLARHDPGKVIADLAIALALGGDCLADVALLRAEPGVFGPVASDPTVSPTIDALADDAPRSLAGIETARAAARARVWQLDGDRAPDHEGFRRAPADRRCRCHAGHRTLGQGTGRTHIQAWFRFPTALGHRRPRTGGDR